MLERVDSVEKPFEPWELKLELEPVSRSGQLVARLEGVVVERENFRLGPVDLELARGDRLARNRAERKRQVHTARRAYG